MESSTDAEEVSFDSPSSFLSVIVRSLTPSSFSHLDAVRAVAFHQTDLCFATASDDCTVKVWRLDPDELLPERFVASLLLSFSSDELDPEIFFFFFFPLLGQHPPRTPNLRSPTEATPTESRRSSSRRLSSESTPVPKTRRSAFGSSPPPTTSSTQTTIPTPASLPSSVTRIPSGLSLSSEVASSRPVRTETSRCGIQSLL